MTAEHAAGTQLASGYIDLTVKYGTGMDQIRNDFDKLESHAAVTGQKAGNALGGGITSALGQHSSRWLDDTRGLDMTSKATRIGAQAGFAIATGIGGGLNKVEELGGRAFRNLGEHVKGFGEKVAEVATGPIMKIGVTLAALEGVKTVFERGFKRVEGIENATRSLEALGYSAQQIQGMMKSAQDATKGTAYGLGDVLKATETAFENGITGDKLTTYVTDLENVAAVTGKTVDDIGQVMQKAKTKDKVTMRDIVGLTTDRAPLGQWLQKDLGLGSDGALAQAISDGKVTFQDLFDTITKHSAGAAVAMSHTWSGQMHILGNEIGKIGSDILEPFMESGTDGLGSVTTAFDKLDGWIKDHQPQIVEGVGKIGIAFETVAAGIAEFVGDTLHIFGDLEHGFANVIRWAADAVGIFSDSKANAMRQAADAMDRNQESVDALNDKLHHWSEHIHNEVIPATQAWADKTAAATKETDGLGDSAEAASTSVSALTDAITAYNSTPLAPSIGGSAPGSGVPGRNPLDFPGSGLPGLGSGMPGGGGQGLLNGAAASAWIDQRLAAQGLPGGRVAPSDAPLLARIRAGRYETLNDSTGPGDMWDLTKGLGDCSSAVEDLVNLIDGNSTAGRAMATGNEADWLTAHGFLPGVGGPGDFRVGFNSHHTQATLPGGTNFNWGSDNAAAKGGVDSLGAYDPSFTAHYFRPAGRQGDDSGTADIGTPWGSVPVNPIAGQQDPNPWGWGKSPSEQMRDRQQLDQLNEKIADLTDELAKATDEQTKSNAKLAEVRGSFRPSQDELDAAQAGVDAADQKVKSTREALKDAHDQLALERQSQADDQAKSDFEQRQALSKGSGTSIWDSLMPDLGGLGAIGQQFGQSMLPQGWDNPFDSPILKVGSGLLRFLGGVVGRFSPGAGTALSIAGSVLGGDLSGAGSSLKTFMMQPGMMQPATVGVAPGSPGVVLSDPTGGAIPLPDPAALAGMSNLTQPDGPFGAPTGPLPGPSNSIGNVSVTNNSTTFNNGVGSPADLDRIQQRDNAAQARARTNVDPLRILHP